MRKFILPSVLCSLALLAFSMTSCSTAPNTPSGRDALRDDGDRSLASMKQNDPGLENLLNNSYGYAILPSIGEGGAGIGGAYGKGVVYRQGKFAGYTDMSQGSIGAELGGQTYAELVVFQNQDAYWQLESGKMSFGAEASAIALKAGASAQAQFVHGVAIFVQPSGGLMFNASLNGQKFTFRPADSTNNQ